MPGVVKVDSVWTTFVKTPHPSLKNTKFNLCIISGLMVSALDLDQNDGPVSSPDLGHCVLGQDTTLKVPLCPRCIKR